MSANELIKLEQSQSTPQVEFDPKGKLLIKGRSFCEDPKNFYAPLIEYCQKLQVQDVIIDIIVDYLNTSSSKCMLELIFALEDNKLAKSVQLRWHYDQDDEEMLETGEIYEEECNKVKFSFIPVVEEL